MRKNLFATALAAGAFLSLFSGGPAPAYATPTCGPAGTGAGDTITVASGDSVSAPILLTANTCVLAGDKIFGSFGVGGALPGTGSASFTFGPSITGNVTVGFSGALAASSTGTLTYDVAVDQALAQGWEITGVEKDFTFNATNNLLAAGARLQGTTTSGTNPPLNIDCTRGNGVGSAPPTTCPQTQNFSPILDLVLNETLTTDANTTVTALTDTIFQSPPAVPEPASMLLLGTGLLGLGVIAGRRRR